MVVVVVLAILVGIAIPSFMTMAERNLLTTQTNQLVGAINLARTEAIKRGSNVSFRLVSSTWTIMRSSETLSTGSVDAKLVVTPNTAVSSGIVFTRDGLAYDGNDLATGSISVCSSKLSSENLRTVEISSGGKVIATRGNRASCTGG